MRITESQLRKIIASLLNESRIVKQKFYDQVRTKHPEIDRAYFVAWWGDGYESYKDDTMTLRPVWDTTKEELNKILPKLSGATFDISANLVDPAGLHVEPHGGAWGSVGFVFQGIPTAGFHRDMASSSKVTQSDETRIDFDNIKDYDAQTDLFSRDDLYVEDPDDPFEIKRTHGPVEKQIDDTIDDVFLTHHPRFEYSYNEFSVVPKKAVGLVYFHDWEELEFPDEADWPTQIADIPVDIRVQKMRQLAKEFNLPIAVGKKQIGQFYRNLYKK